MDQQHVPETEYAKYIHEIKYQTNETFEESKNRIASVLCDDPDHYHEFRTLLLDQAFLPAGRIQANLGKARKTTAINCFVLDEIQDSFCFDPVLRTGKQSIIGSANLLARTLRAGGGVGHDWSKIRPRGERIKSLEANASGPVSFMRIFDSVCQATQSGGHRRGAQLASLRIDHPDVEEFVSAKHDQHSLTSMNISIAVTDEFMEALEAGKDFDLRFNGKTYKTIDPRNLWEKVMRSTWDWAEPGILFIDTINRKNNLKYCEEIHTSNPCGEQVLPPNGSCLLGSFNLVKYLRDGTFGWHYFDYEKFQSDIPIVLRAMDNVIDRTMYPTKEQEREMKSKRRIGIGITGVANAIETLGHPYGTTGFIITLRTILAILRNTLYRSSIVLAQERGSFPLLDVEKYCESDFIKRLPHNIQEGIRKYGIRNSHLLSIAPCGTISLCADNVSSSIEPVFAKSLARTYITEEGEREVMLEDYAWKKWGTEPLTADRVSADAHLNVLATAQEFVDASCSKTINMDSSMPWSDFKELYTRAWKMGIKGLSTFNSNGKRTGILRSVSEGESCRIDPETGIRTCDE